MLKEKPLIWNCFSRKCFSHQFSLSSFLSSLPCCVSHFPSTSLLLLLLLCCALNSFPIEQQQKSWQFLNKFWDRSFYKTSLFFIHTHTITATRLNARWFCHHIICLDFFPTFLKENEENISLVLFKFQTKWYKINIYILYSEYNYEELCWESWIFIVVVKIIVDNDEWSIQVSGCQESTLQSISATYYNKKRISNLFYRTLAVAAANSTEIDRI